MFDSARNYVDDSFRVDWDNYFKIYKGKRVNRHYAGVSDPIIREPHTIIETLVANIAGGDPEFSFVQTNQEQSDDTEVLNEMMKYYLNCEQMGLKNQEWVRDMLMYGTGIIHVTWDGEEGRPCIDNIPIRDFFVSPSAKTINKARYAGFEYLADREDLEDEEVYDAETDSMVAKYKNLNSTELSPNTGTSSTGTAAPIDKEFKDQFNGSTLGELAMKSQLHIIMLYDLYTDTLMEIANRKVVIRETKIPYQREEETRKVMITGPDGREVETEQKLDAIKSFLPFAVLRDYVDTSIFYGEGELAIIADRAEMLNDLEAMDTDNIAYQNTPMYQIDPQFAEMAPEIETIPGAVYAIPKGAISPLERPQLGGDLDEKKDRVESQMRRSTAADEAVQGVKQTGRVTATEVSTQLAQAQNRFSTKLSNLEDEGYALLGTIIFKMVQIFVTQKEAIRIVGKKGVKFKDFDPWEYNGKYEPHVKLDSKLKQEAMEVGQKNNQMYMMMSSSEIYDPVEIQRFFVQKLDPEVDDEKFNSMLAKAPTAPPPPPPKTPQETITFNYKDAPPDVQRSIEKMFELPPSDVGNEMAMNQHVVDTLGKVPNDSDIGPNNPPPPMPGEEGIAPPESAPAEPPVM